MPALTCWNVREGWETDVRRKSEWVAAVSVGVALLAAIGSVARGKAGPFDPEKLPPTIDPAKIVHFVSVDGAFTAPNPNWRPTLHVLTNGDQQTESVEIGGHKAVKVMGIKFNTADDDWQFWAKEHAVDILMQVYGDETLVNPDGTSRYFNFLTGTVPEPIAIDGGEFPTGINNGRWNWVLFRVTNGLGHFDGGRLIGTLHPKYNSSPGYAESAKRSGQNTGTIRMDGLHEDKIRFVAFGQKGAFGEPEQINRVSRK